jgi:hypothetical protein|nr:hypothetical protein [uncultured Oscillibacter sp.]
MPVTEFLLFAAFILGMALLGMWLCLWAAKKAGIQPLPAGYHYCKKLSYDNWTEVLDTRTSARRRFSFGSKKGGTLSMEVTHTKGSMVLEFYTKDGWVLQSWRNGDPASFIVELPPGVRVYIRANMTCFTGSIRFLR